MLKTRLLTAVVLATLVVSGLFYLPPAAVAVVLGSFLVVGAWEWSRLLGWSQRGVRIAYALALALAAIAIWRWNEAGAVFAGLQMSGVCWWVLAAVLVMLAQSLRLGRGIGLASNPLAGAFVLLPAWSGIAWLIRTDPTMLLVLFALIWTADAAAYFVGRKWGRRRLAVNVSPGKTWEGVAGGLVFGTLVAVITSSVLVFSDTGRLGFIVVGLFTIAVSVVGDLFVSMMKRHVGVKDSGRILPGHGGVMDRIDGLVAAAPVFCAGLYFWVNRL